MNHELIETYRDLIGELEGSLEPDAAAIHGLLVEIEADANLSQVEQAFLRGYMGYHFLDVLTQVDCEAEFRGVLAHDPDHDLANLYLGYQTFDIGNYATAMEQFQKINLDPHFLWSQIKIRELIVCCHLHLQQFLEAEELLCPVLRQAMELDSNDDYAHPIELLEALAEWHAEFSAVIGADAWQCDIKLLMDVLQKYDLTDTFAEQLAQISP